MTFDSRAGGQDGVLPEFEREDTAAMSAPPHASADRFSLQAIRFAHAPAVAVEALEAIMAEYIERPITYDDLNFMVARLNGLLRQRGISTGAACISPHRTRSGELQIELVGEPDPNLLRADVVADAVRPV